MKKLGARQYIDNKSQNAVEELNKLGGAKVILATVPSGKAMTEILGGLAANGKLVIIGASDEPVEVPYNRNDIRTQIIDRLASRYVNRLAGYTFV